MPRGTSATKTMTQASATQNPALTPAVVRSRRLRIMRPTTMAPAMPRTGVISGATSTAEITTAALSRKRPIVAMTTESDSSMAKRRQ